MGYPYKKTKPECLIAQGHPGISFSYSISARYFSTCSLRGILYVLDYRKVQDAIFLEVFTFDIFCKLKDFVDGLKNVFQAASVPNLLSHISESCRY